MAATVPEAPFDLRNLSPLSAKLPTGMETRRVWRLHNARASRG